MLPLLVSIVRIHLNGYMTEDEWTRYLSLTRSQNTNASQEYSKFVKNILVKYDGLKETIGPNTTITSFEQRLPPPRITDDFEHFQKPYIQNGSVEELRLFSDSGYKKYLLSTFILYGLKFGFFNESNRKEHFNIDMDLIPDELERWSFLKGIVWKKKFNLDVKEEV